MNDCWSLIFHLLEKGSIKNFLFTCELFASFGRTKEGQDFIYANTNHLWTLIRKYPEAKWDWSMISGHQKTYLENIVDVHDNAKLDWFLVSRNPNITWDDIVMTKTSPALQAVYTKWEWFGLTGNPNITLENILEDSNHDWNWGNLRENQQPTMSQLAKMEKDDDPVFPLLNQSMIKMTWDEIVHCEIFGATKSTYDWFNRVDYYVDFDWSHVVQTFEDDCLRAIRGWDWSLISSKKEITWNIIKSTHPKTSRLGLWDKWDIEAFCRSESVKWDDLVDICSSDDPLIRDLSNKLYWDALVENPNMTWEIVRDNPSYPWVMEYFIYNPNCTTGIVRSITDIELLDSWKWNWSGQVASSVSWDDIVNFEIDVPLYELDNAIKSPIDYRTVDPSKMDFEDMCDLVDMLDRTGVPRAPLEYLITLN